MQSSTTMNHYKLNYINVVCDWTLFIVNPCNSTFKILIKHSGIIETAHRWLVVRSVFAAHKDVARTLGMTKFMI